MRETLQDDDNDDSDEDDHSESESNGDNENDSIDIGVEMTRMMSCLLSLVTRKKLRGQPRHAQEEP